MSKNWYEICVTVGNQDAEQASASLFEAGFAGIEERPLGDDRMTLVVFAECSDADEIAAARARAAAVVGAVAPDGEVAETSDALDPAVWTENWRRHFPRLEVGQRLIVLPPWEPLPTDHRLTIVINPGLAFGTGHHETTEGCLLLIDEMVGPGVTVADVGCGSGILAIAAAKLGAAACLATDIDPDALAATRENAVANGVEKTVTVHATLPPAQADGTGTYNFVIANILAETLVEIRASLEAAVALGGTLILSGIAQSHRSLVENAFFPEGWETSRAVEAGDWVTLALHRRAVS
ncbi:MAG: ribosomal protein L11 methyltransferase [Hyphomicrobiaceae bacterium]|jgi:ribosomal protein L11 methyltransferase